MPETTRDVYYRYDTNVETVAINQFEFGRVLGLSKMMVHKILTFHDTLSAIFSLMLNVLYMVINLFTLLCLYMLVACLEIVDVVSCRTGTCI